MRLEQEDVELPIRQSDAQMVACEALGAVLHEMVTGRRAFEGTSKASVIAAILERPVPAASTVLVRGGGESVAASVLDDVIAKCLAKHPDERWQSASDLCQALEWAGGPLHPVLPKRRILRGRHTAPLAWIASAVVVAGLLAVAGRWNRTPAPAGARPMRWLVTPPDGAVLDPSPFALALSPDGTHLAFIASSETGGNALWVRPVDSLAARKLADGASQPFWSADSRSIAFEGGGQVKNVDLATGLVQPLVDTFAVSGSWSREGPLLLSLPRGEHRHDAGVLYTVSAPGRPLTAATTLDRGQAESRHAGPHFLPDGRRFLYLARGEDPDQPGTLYVGSLDDPERVPLFQTRSRAVYGSGYLLFVEGRTLLARKFDPAALRLGRAGARRRRSRTELDGCGVLRFRRRRAGVSSRRTDRARLGRSQRTIARFHRGTRPLPQPRSVTGRAACCRRPRRSGKRAV